MKVFNFIAGAMRPALSGRWLDNIEPATGQVYGQLPDSDARDVEEAYRAAKKAFPLWAGLSVEERYRYLMRIAERIEARAQELAEAESRDNGKPLWLAQSVDIPRASKNFRFFATAALHFGSESYEMRKPQAINYVLRKPLGVVGCISPWNLPLYLFTWKVAPALAAGNTVVAKPSELTPVTAYLLGEICSEVGLPEGVLNIVQGLGARAGAAIVAHPDIVALSFTGGTKTGAEIARVAAPMFKKLSLELGGKNPNIIFADAPYGAMLSATLRSSFANQGQICLCGSRIFIEQSLYERFKEDFIRKIEEEWKVGPPLEEDTKVGALISESHMQKVLRYIELAKSEGGTVLTGGHRVRLRAPWDKGYYVAPTVIEGLPNNCRTNQEEIFGPVVSLMPFETEEEVLAMANAVPYGLSATVWTRDLSRAHRLADRLETGIVWINTWLLRDLRTPFGGVKASGVGREGGFEALRFFTEPKTVCIRYDV